MGSKPASEFAVSASADPEIALHRLELISVKKVFFMAATSLWKAGDCLINKNPDKDGFKESWLLQIVQSKVILSNSNSWSQNSIVYLTRV